MKPGLRAEERESDALAISGRRVLLRPLAQGDASAALEAVQASSAQLRRRFKWAQDVLSSDDVLRHIRSKSAGWDAGSSCTFGIFDARGQRLVGMMSLDPIEAETSKARLSFWIRAEEQGKGYASEAGRLVVEHGLRRLSLRRLFARIDPSNRVARRVLQKLGFHYEGCLRGDERLANRWIDQECWGVLRTEWKPAARRIPHPALSRTREREKKS